MKREIERERGRGGETEREREAEGARQRERDCHGVSGLSFSVRLRPSEPEKQLLAWVVTENIL